MVQKYGNKEIRGGQAVGGRDGCTAHELLSFKTVAQKKGKNKKNGAKKTVIDDGG